MNKKNQSILDILESLPLSSYLLRGSPISNKEAQTLYGLWSNGETDEYGKIIIDSSVDPMQITSLTANGYIKNAPSQYAAPWAQRTLEFTNKGKEAIKKIILHQEKSTFDKSSNIVDYEKILRESNVEVTIEKTASKGSHKLIKQTNWLQKSLWN